MKQSRPVGVREIGEVFGPAPEWDTIRRPFLPWGITRTLSIDEVNVLRRLDLWERNFRNLRERVKNSKLRKVLHGESIDFRRNKLAHLVNHHPLPNLGTLSNSLLRTGGPSNQLFKAFGSYFGRNITSTTKKEDPYRRNIAQEDEILLQTPSFIHGFDIHSNYSFIRTSRAAFIINQHTQEKLSSFKTKVQMTDFISLNTDLKTAVSTVDGVVTLYDASDPYAKFEVYPKGENFGREWNITRTMDDVIVSAGRDSLYMIVPSQNDIVPLAKEALPKDYISDVLISSNAKDFFIISRSTLNLYDARKLKSPLLSWAHGMENLPAAGGDVLHHNGVDYYSIYNRDGEVFLWAYDNVNIRGLPRRFSPLYDILNYTPFDEEATYRRASCPWTGIQLFAPGKKKKYLYVVTTNALGDLFCMEIKKSGDENQDFDWLLESRYNDEEVEVLKNFEDNCRESFFVKKSTCCKLFVRKDHSFDTKWSFPKVEAKPQSEIVKSIELESEAEEDEAPNLSRTRNKPDRNPFKNFESLKLLDFRTCKDKESQRIRKILKRKPVFDDIPSDTESDSTFCTESVKSRSIRSDSNASNSELEDNDDLPTETDNMLGQFFNDLNPNMTSTQERGEALEEIEEEEMIPLTVGTQSEFSEFQSLSQIVDSRSFLSTKKKKRKSKVMGF